MKRINEPAMGGPDRYPS